MDTYTATKNRSDTLAAHVDTNPQDYRILTGDRPTGHLHLGHLFGTINERVRLQDRGVDTTIVIADYQVITDRDTTANVRDNVTSLVLDYLAAGIDPTKTTIFAQSAVPALNQLMLPFLSLVSEAELHRNPTVKAEAEASGRALSGLMLTYPVSQACDIAAFKGNLVPVGKDQLPHLELARTLTRRFNTRYATVFPEPQALLSDTPEVPGLDGRKMSKSYANTITLSATAEQTSAVIRKVPTDQDRTITFDPSTRPGISALLTTAALCLGVPTNALADQVGNGGAGALKVLAAEAVNDYLTGHRARRTQYANDPHLVADILADGNARANTIAEATLAEVRHAMGTTY